MALSVRKRGAKTAEDGKIDVPQGSADVKEVVVKSSASADDKPDLVFWTLVAIALFFFIYDYGVPKATQLAHKKVIDQQLEGIATTIEEQRKSLAQQYESLSAQMNEKLGLIAKTEETEAPGGDSNVAELQQVVANLQEKMGEIKEQEFDQDAFCEDCAGIFKKGAYKCSEFRDTLMNRCGHSKKVASEAVMKLDPDNCMKRHESDSDHAKFCEYCIGNFVGGALRTSCRKRRDYFINKYGNSLELATEAVMALDPANCIM
mmetsp:Transcript_19429/g.26965  ORF Transcript_19429/g.26965 Transcript_19429/m.26965 type:complete len:261 (+) Transcript_19429:27-809(+)